MGGGEVSRGGLGLHAKKVQRAFRRPSIGFEPEDLRGVTVLGPVRLHDWLRAGLRRAGSEGLGSWPVQLVGLQGIRECQGLASSSSSPPLSSTISPLRAISCKCREVER